MSDHNLAEALRQIIYQAERGTLARCEQLARDALASIYEAEQQAGEAVAIVELKTCGGNAGLSTRIKEIEDPMRDRLTAGTKLFTHPQQPLTEIRRVAIIMQAWSIREAIEMTEGAHGITKDTK